MVQNPNIITEKIDVEQYILANKAKDTDIVKIIFGKKYSLEDHYSEVKPGSRMFLIMPGQAWLDIYYAVVETLKVDTFSIWKRDDVLILEVWK